MTSLDAPRTFRLLLILAGLGSLTVVSVAHSVPDSRDIGLSAQAQTDLAIKFTNRLHLNPDQTQRALPIVRDHLGKIVEFHNNSLLNVQERRQKFIEERRALRKEIAPILGEEQFGDLDFALDHLHEDGTLGRSKPIIPLISVTYEKFFASNSAARSIFGSSPTAIQFGVRELVESPSQRTRLNLGFDTFDINNSGNKLFTAGPEVSYEYRIPINKGFSAYTRLSGGPLYMDYSFDLPSGEHDAAKTFGAGGGIEAGLRYGRVQLSGAYRIFTQPAGINFNGFQVDLTYVVVRF